MKRSGIRGFEAMLYRQQVAVLILHPNWVKTGMGKYNAPLPVEKDAELNESFDLENQRQFLRAGRGLQPRP